MDETRFAEEFLRKMQAGEFDGRLYEIITKLSAGELQQIVKLAESHPGTRANGNGHAPRVEDPVPEVRRGIGQV